MIALCWAFADSTQIMFGQSLSAKSAMAADFLIQGFHTIVVLEFDFSTMMRRCHCGSMIVHVAAVLG